MVVDLTLSNPKNFSVVLSRNTFLACVAHCILNKHIRQANVFTSQVDEVANKTGQNRSSMLQDVSRGAETEIEAINGAIVREGLGMGVPTPVNMVLLKLVTSSRDLRNVV